MIRSSERDPDLVSVIVPCVGPPASLRACLGALFRHTRRPRWELVAVVKNDAAAVSWYLSGLADGGARRVVVTSHPAARNLRTAWRRGLASAGGGLVAFLSPTTIVTDAWLEQLAALIRSDPTIVLAGPMTNSASGPQRSQGPGSDESDAVEAFAARWRRERRGRWFEADSLDGRCLLARRDLLDAAEGRREVRAAGLRGRRLVLRARRFGGRAAVANDLYVHEMGRPKDGDARGTTVAAVSESRPKVSLTMIVRDEEANLPHCLGSVAGLFDEIVVVDTGSTDRTVEVARSFGARVSEFAWVSDFSAARNAALARASGAYAFWLDADDRVEASERPKLEKLLRGLRSTDAAYVVRCACDADSGGGGATVVDHVRLFPIRDDVRWTYRVHEQILPALRRAGVQVRWTDLTIRHTGYNDPDLRATKLRRDAAILEAELMDRPDDPFVLFNLGSVALESGRWREALGHLRRSLAGSAPRDSITMKLFALISRCHQTLGEMDLALAACTTGLRIEPEDPELWFRRGVLHRSRGEAHEAEACWRKVLSLGRPERFGSVDQGIFGHVTRRNLARLAEERGVPREAERLWREILAERPGDEEASLALESSASARPLDRSLRLIIGVDGGGRP